MIIFFNYDIIDIRYFEPIYNSLKKYIYDIYSKTSYKIDFFMELLFFYKLKNGSLF